MSHDSKIDLTARTLRINHLQGPLKQSTTVPHDGLVNRTNNLAKVIRGSNGVIKLTYYNHHQNSTIIKTIQNTDADGNPKQHFIGPVTNNAERVRRWRNESDFQTIEADEDRETQVTQTPKTDAAWRADVAFFGVRDALLGMVQFGSGRIR